MLPNKSDLSSICECLFVLEPPSFHFLASFVYRIASVHECAVSNLLHLCLSLVRCLFISFFRLLSSLLETADFLFPIKKMLLWGCHGFSLG